MRKAALPFLIAVSPLVVGGMSLFWGAYSVSPPQVARVILSRLFFFDAASAAELSIVWDIRLPRIILSALVGGALAAAGVTFQGIFRNPLVDPFILGLSAGAAFGCALSTALVPSLPVQVAAFAFSLAASFVTYSLAKSQGQVSRLPLVLSGVVVSAFFTAAQAGQHRLLADGQLLPRGLAFRLDLRIGVRRGLRSSASHALAPERSFHGR